MNGQRGVAAVTAILIVAVAASAAAMMLAQQSAMLDQTMLVASRAQADQYAQAGLDWARGVLAQDARASQIDTLEEGWARPIVGLPIERAVVAGAIADEQGKFNLNNLVEHRRSEADVKLLRQLLASLDLNPDLADAAAEWIDPNASDAYYLSLPRPYRSARGPMTQLEELHRVRGFTLREIERLRPYVTALRGRTPINVNTASDRLIAAAFGASRDKVAPLLAERQAKPFATKAAFVEASGKLGLIAVNDFDVKSDWFTVVVRVSQDDVQLATEALIRREPGPQSSAAIIWRRPRY